MNTEVGSLQHMTPNTLGKVQYVRYINFKRVQNKEHNGTKNIYLKAALYMEIQREKSEQIIILLPTHS